MSDLSAIPPAELTKLQHIISLMDGTSFESEAATAAAMATNILMKYSLSLEEAKASIKGMSEEDKDGVTQVTTPVEGATALPTYLNILVNSISQSCLCQPIIGQDTVYFIGKAREAQTAKLIFNELYQRMTAIVEIRAANFNRQYRQVHSRNYWDLRELGNPHKVKRDWKKSWLTGCASGIAETLQKQFQEQVATTVPGNALMVRRSDEISEYITRQYPDSRTLKTRSNDMHRNALSDGYREGREMGSSAGTRKLTD